MAEEALVLRKATQAGGSRTCNATDRNGRILLNEFDCVFMHGLLCFKSQVVKG